MLRHDGNAVSTPGPITLLRGGVAMRIDGRDVPPIDSGGTGAIAAA